MSNRTKRAHKPRHPRTEKEPKPTPMLQQFWNWFLGGVGVKGQPQVPIFSGPSSISLHKSKFGQKRRQRRARGKATA